MPKKPITESVEVYPAGRGHILAIIKKKTPPKTRKYKHPQPRFTHARIQMNPEDLVITEYLDSDESHKYIYLFPQALQLSKQEREDLALSLLATLPSTPRYLGKRKTMKPLDNFPVFLTQNQRQTLKKKWMRYTKWRKQQQ